MSWLVPQRIKIEGHNRYVVEFREDGTGTRAFPFTVTSDPPKVDVRADPEFLDVMALMGDQQATMAVVRQVRQFHNLRQHFLTCTAAAAVKDE